MKKIIFLLLTVVIISCKQERNGPLPAGSPATSTAIKYARGFTIHKNSSGVTIIKISSPWPDAQTAFTYALVPKDILAAITLNKEEYDAIIPVPVTRLVATSTTHIPAIEALGEADKLVGFPGTNYISSPLTRKRTAAGLVRDLGNNEAINTEILISLVPEVVIGFSIDNKNKAYDILKNAYIPVVYNGDWTEETPLGKAEWIKFFAPFFQKEKLADSIFSDIETEYKRAKALAQHVNNRPTVLTGGVFKDVWHVAGGKSWMAQFLKDANTDYIWKDTKETGSISLSFESVLSKAGKAEFWLNPSLHTSYKEMLAANRHYHQFEAFKNNKVYTTAMARGETGGLLFYELAANRPDIVLQDLIFIFHPEVLPDHQPVFFQPLK